MSLNRRSFLASTGLALAGSAMALPARADDNVVKIGLIAPMTGPFTSTGRMLEEGARLYIKQAGDTVAGKKIELVLRDDTGVADVTKRIAQEMVANDGVKILTGFGLTPLALAVAPLATQAKVPEIVMMAATSVVTERSPFIVRPAFTQAQTTVPLADWAYDNGIRKVVSIVADYAPGLDSEAGFNTRFKAKGGEVLEAIRVPLSTRDFAPFLQRAVDAKPEALFVFVPTGLGAALMKQFVERGLDKSGIKVLGEGSVTEDDILTQMDDSVLGMITAHHYSAAHRSAENAAFVAAFRKAYGHRPNHIAVQAYDGMHLIYEALKKTGGATDGAALVAAMKGLSWESPRGPVTIDPNTREPIQNIYIRRVERVDGELYNVEFATVPNVKDPSKAGL
ncbi:ABC transporter substrate-binding protein [Ancylobacter oerskovii]|uniref:ABC transporter substrate-binding protein n=1 Tax=Ancylobacter oerskovii TaxID=459519 RepID=A0ABW4YTG5_9HYPH|nr:ABC transporter substrate-binding protein [Ancylobacter oerskovii]MBS7543449.1 ABC transporter substrate-binding protein [Ancylobacter oerskovii]